MRWTHSTRSHLLENFAPAAHRREALGADREGAPPSGVEVRTSHGREWKRAESTDGKGEECRAPQARGTRPLRAHAGRARTRPGVCVRASRRRPLRSRISAPRARSRGRARPHRRGRGARASGLPLPRGRLSQTRCGGAPACLPTASFDATPQWQSPAHGERRGCDSEGGRSLPRRGVGARVDVCGTWGRCPCARHHALSRRNARRRARPSSSCSPPRSDFPQRTSFAPRSMRPRGSRR